MAGLKMVTSAKISLKMVNPRDIAGECRRRRGKAGSGQVIHRYRGSSHPYIGWKSWLVWSPRYAGVSHPYTGWKNWLVWSPRYVGVSHPYIGWKSWLVWSPRYAGVSHPYIGWKNWLVWSPRYVGVSHPYIGWKSWLVWSPRYVGVNHPYIGWKSWLVWSPRYVGVSHPCLGWKSWLVPSHRATWGRVVCSSGTTLTLGSLQHWDSFFFGIFSHADIFAVLSLCFDFSVRVILLGVTPCFTGCAVHFQTFNWTREKTTTRLWGHLRVRIPVAIEKNDATYDPKHVILALLWT